MSDLVAIAFSSKEKAQQALQRAVEMQKQHLVDLGDAVIVTKDENGKVNLQQSINTTAMGAASGGLWGALIGMLFLNPLLGLAVGAASRSARRRERSAATSPTSASTTTS